MIDKDASYLALELGIHYRHIPQVISSIYAGIIEDDVMGWSEAQFLEWLDGTVQSFPTIREETILTIYDHMSMAIRYGSNLYREITAISYI